MSMDERLKWNKAIKSNRVVADLSPRARLTLTVIKAPYPVTASVGRE